ncbi:MAG: hypothetical protein NWQ45_14145, partial [Congregibacter sp.]|nr:hypothetical protein [Congregibacter sp.]
IKSTKSGASSNCGATPTAIVTAAKQIAAQHDNLLELKTMLFHPGFPVDIRHNSKIGRAELAAWAAQKVHGPETSS